MPAAPSRWAWSLTSTCVCNLVHRLTLQTAEDHGYGLAFVVFSSVFGSGTPLSCNTSDCAVLGPIVGGFIEQYASWIRAIRLDAADIFAQMGLLDAVSERLSPRC